jgi:hypothetical protein
MEEDKYLQKVYCILFRILLRKLSWFSNVLECTEVYNANKNGAQNNNSYNDELFSSLERLCSDRSNAESQDDSS